jgi:hypothetical protein
MVVWRRIADELEACAMFAGTILAPPSATRWVACGSPSAARKSDSSFNSGLHGTWAGRVERDERTVGLDNIAGLARALKARPGHGLESVG